MRNYYAIAFFWAAILYAPSGWSQCIAGNCDGGAGIYIFSGGKKYIGEFNAGSPHGVGTMFYASGEKYYGEWSRGEYHGQGIRTTTRGGTEQGQWKRGQLVRPTEEALVPYRSRFSGTVCFQGNCQNGSGIIVFSNGAVYVGEFLNGRMHGDGICYYSDNSTYEGRWANGYPDGYGAKTYANGSFWNGRWSAGQPIDDYGNVISEHRLKNQANNTRRTGCVSGNCLEGYGTFLFPSGDRYVGMFRAGKPHGVGSILYANGDRYEGQMENGNLNGQGTLYYADGREVAGYWKKGSLTKQGENRTPVLDEEMPKVWAVVIGIAAYNHMPALKYTDDDAYKVYAFLRSPEGGGLPEEQIRILIDEDATRAEILQSLKAVYRQAGPQDLVITYFSGHGLPGAFLPYDFDGSVQQQIRHIEITNLLADCRAKYKLWIADACHSGSLPEYNTRGGGSDHTLISYYHSLAQARAGTALIMSSKSNETSLEAGGLRQGVFSHFLIRGLKGEADVNGDYLISLEEIFQFVYQRVRKYTNNRQSPVIRGNYDRSMTVAVRRQ